MQYSIIQRLQLEGALRLDAEYYQPKYLELIKKLNSLGAVLVKEVAKTVKRKFKAEDDKFFDYIEIAEVNLRTGEYNIEKIIGKEAPDRAQWVVKKNDVLISTVRPIRNAVVLIKEEKENLVCSSGFVVLKSEKISPQYLFIYLKTKPIVKLLDRYTTASMYPAITLDDILNTKIYLGEKSFRNEISKSVNEAFNLLGHSKSFYSQAENLLLEELGLKDFRLEDDLSYTVNLSDVKLAHRVDAKYFQPKYRKMINIFIKKFNGKKIKDLNFIRVTTGQYCDEYAEKGKLYIRGLNISRGTIEINNFVYISQDKQIESKKAKEGDVVVTRVGTVGISARLPKDVERGTISDNLIRLRFLPEKLDPYYLSLFLNSIGSSFMIRESRGSVQPRLNQETLKEIIIPILPKSTQQKIADLVCQSHAARKKAKELLEKAKQKVEELTNK